jgi:hypothetical protein
VLCHETCGLSLQAQVTDARDRHPPKNGLGLLPLGPDPVHRRTSPADARRLDLQTSRFATYDLTKQRSVWRYEPWRLVGGMQQRDHLVMGRIAWIARNHHVS